MQKKWFVLFVCTLALVLSAVSPVFARDIMPDTWVGALIHDGVHMDMPTYDQVGGPKSDKTVGMFYYIWMSTHTNGYDAQDLYHIGLGEIPYGTEKSYHWWSEPYFGYYHNQDPFIIRKHAQMLTDAGIDVIMFDNTNAVVYPEVITSIINEYAKMKEEGMDVPKITSVFNSNPGQTAIDLYNSFFDPNKVDAKLYAKVQDLWFKWNGRYLLLGDISAIRSEAGADSEAYKLFSTFETRKCWINYGEKSWAWVSQNWSYATANGVAEEVAVSTADPSVTGKGKSSTRTSRLTSGHNPRNGTFFKAQWEHALSVNPRFVFVTQWNEFIAIYFKSSPNRNPGFLSYFVDCWSWEYNRDIEPMRDYHDRGYGYGDNYYYYLTYYIRRYKGVRQIPASSAAKTIDVTGSASQWNDVAPEFLDDINDEAYRNYLGSVTRDPLRADDEYYHYVAADQACYYTNFTGDNDLDTVKVTRDGEFVYFYLKCQEDVSPAKASRWMNVLINRDCDYRDGFYGYDFMINRNVDVDSMLGSVEVTSGGWNWTTIGWVDLYVEGNVLQFAVPRVWLDLKGAGSQTMDIKAFDGMPYDDAGFDPIQFLDMGDCAPNARFNYRYKADFPALSNEATTYNVASVDVDLNSDLQYYVLNHIASDLTGADHVEFITIPRRGVIDNGKYVKNVMLGEFNERLNYRVKDANDKTLAYGTLALKNEALVNTFIIKDAKEQTLSINHNTKEAVLSTYYTTKLWKAKLIPDCEGTIILNGMDVNGRNVFDLYHSKTNNELVYTEDGETIVYNLTVNWADPPVATNTTTYFPNNSVPVDGDPWTVTQGTLTVGEFAGTTTLVGNSIAANHVFGTVDRYASPSIFTCMLASDDKTDHIPFSNFFNLRSVSNFDYITECRGIWIAVNGNKVRLFINGTGASYTQNFNHAVNYSTATIENMTPAYEAFVTLRVTDNGSNIKISVLDKDGAYVDVFNLTNIGTSGFDFENLITGETGSGRMKENSIANPGHMGFFHHAGNQTYWGPMNFATNFEDIKLGISMAALLDKATGKEVSKNVLIDNEKFTVTFTVSETQDIKSIEPVFCSTMKGTIFRVGGKLLSTNPYVALSDTKATSMLVIGGGATRTYKVYVNRGTVPEFEFDGVTSQNISIDTQSGIITAKVGYDTDLSQMRLITNSDGVTYLNDVYAAHEWFDFRNQLTGHTVVYTENGVTQNYTLNIVVDQKSTQTTAVPNNYAGTSLPDNASLWRVATGVYKVQTKHGATAIGPNGDFSTTTNDLLSLKETFTAPYVLEYDIAVDNTHIFPNTANGIGFTNLRSNTNGDWITSFAGIWFGCYGSNMYLLTSSNNFADYTSYSIAPMTGTVNVEQGYVTVRACDTGDDITIYAKRTNGSWDKLFYIYDITSSGFSYENVKTGAIGTGISAANSIKEKGYINFFRHAGSNIFLKNIKLYSNLVQLDNKLESFSLQDPATGETVSAKVEIDTNSGMIYVDVVEDVDVANLRVVYNATLDGSTLTHNGEDVQNKTLNFANPVELVLSNGQMGQTYTVDAQSRTKPTNADILNKDIIWLRADAKVDAEEKQANVLIGFYDADGRLISTKIESRKITNGINMLGVELSMDAPENTASVRVFGFGSNFAALDPLFNALSFND